MSQSAFIKFVEGSTVSSMTLVELQDYLAKYKDQLALTGQQLGWEYDAAGFPYTFETKPEGEGKWFYLKGKDTRYKHIVFGNGSDIQGDIVKHYIQVVLPEDATFGDKSKANEFCKHLGKQLKAELHLFNGRIMYYNPRK